MTFGIEQREQIGRIGAGHAARGLRSLGPHPRSEAAATSDVAVPVNLAPGWSLLDLVAPCVDFVVMTVER